jgi:hypothetical protein
MKVSVLGFGGAEIGFQKVPAEQVARLLNAALDAGLNVIDTAECYWAGSEPTASEGLIGQAVAHRRKDYHLLTKVGHPSGLPGENWEPEMMRQSIDRSLRRLKTDAVDLIQLHTCSIDHLKKGDVIAVLREARDKGKTRFIGYSGDSQAARYAVECGAFDTLQTSCNIADQESVSLTVPEAQRRGMGVIAKRPVANVSWKDLEQPTGQYHESYWRRLKKLEYRFLQFGRPTPESVATALGFTLSVPGVSVAIVGTGKPGRWRDNAEALARLKLPIAEFQQIRDRWSHVAEKDWIGQE